jgi:hypothetical protein
LIVTAVLSFAFSTTRRLGVGAVALLALLFPEVAGVLLLIGLVAAAYIYTRKKS